LTSIAPVVAGHCTLIDMHVFTNKIPTFAPISLHTFRL